MWGSFSTIVILLLGHRQVNAGGDRRGYQRSDGLAIGDWCVPPAQATGPLQGMDCTQISGAECVASAGAQPTGNVCQCKAEYDPYDAGNGVQRCRARQSSTVIATMTAADCQLDDDCHQYFATAVCGPPLSGQPFGKCACPKDFILDPNPTTGKTCKAYDCKTDPTVCTTAFGSQADCDKGKSVCICKTGTYFLADNTGKVTCQDWKLLPACSTATPYCPAPLTCTIAKSKCECGSNRIATPQTGNPSTLECKQVSASTAQVGDTCDLTANNMDCPTDAACLAVGASNICVCKPYYKTVTGADGRRVCKTYLGNCCKTLPDCGGTRVPTGVTSSTGAAITAAPLTCMKLNNAARGVCTCPTGQAWDWTTNPPGACTVTAATC
ncbi:uncharacterized protein LOC129586049 [Paramacrobiotus metropolitanus]|uniref:uncharacterized protein LOC129586049 n=1 Tax=Paramacrobiotus metropolitanus TaxID=2943436 RepID=UPI002445B924|nr:uncharacterized protein LOC129586049 [Paramacrobiotus metropolitanus]